MSESCTTFVVLERLARSGPNVAAGGLRPRDRFERVHFAIAKQEMDLAVRIIVCDQYRCCVSVSPCLMISKVREVAYHVARSS
jgi:hypothetical protein